MTDREEVLGVGDHRRETVMLGVVPLQVLVRDEAAALAALALVVPSTGWSAGAPDPSTTSSTQRGLDLIARRTSGVEQRRRETHRQVARVHLRTSQQRLRQSYRLQTLHVLPVRRFPL